MVFFIRTDGKLVFPSYETTVHVYFGASQREASDHVSTMDSNITQIYKTMSKTHSCKVGQQFGKETFHNPLQRGKKKKRKIPGVRLNLLSLHPKSSEQLRKKKKKPKSGTRSYFSVSFGYEKASEGLTFVGTEAIFAVFIEVVGGGAPQEAVVAALRRAAVVLGAHEQEREPAELSVGVAVFHLHHCRNGTQVSETANHLERGCTS